MKQPEYLDLEQSATFRKNYRIYTAVSGALMLKVGRMVGMKTNTLSQILDGKRHVLLEKTLAMRIAEAIDIEIEQMLTEQLLEIDPEVKRYLNDPFNLNRVYALMRYQETGNIKEFLRNLENTQANKMA